MTSLTDDITIKNLLHCIILKHFIIFKFSLLNSLKMKMILFIVITIKSNMIVFFNLNACIILKVVKVMM